MTEPTHLVAEVCLAHRDAYCKACDEFNDDLWVHPRDLPAPHEECHLCTQLAKARQGSVDNYRLVIEQLEEEIGEIERGARHTPYHEQVKR